MSDPVLVCPDCKSPRLIRFGTVFRNHSRVQQYRCNACGKITAKPITPPLRDDKGRFLKKATAPPQNNAVAPPTEV